MKKVLFTATVDSHILQFHLPFLKFFKEHGYEVHVATNGDENIPYCDVKHVVCFERKPIKLNNLKAIKQIKKICEEEKFDIIHCHTPMGSVVTRLAARKARKKGTRVIYTAHGFHFFNGASIKNWLIFYPVEWYLAKYTDTLITINMEDYELAKKKFSKRCKDIQYVPGVGIDEEKFVFDLTDKEKKELRESIGVKKDDFVMIYPAELSKRKRQIWLISTLKDLLNENSNMHLLLPGKDSLNGKCQSLVNDLGLTNQIHFLGYRKDIPKLLKISDMALSSANQEGLPVNIMEAMYIGLPIVASDCRGNRDLVKDGENGYIIGLNDPVEFTKCVKKIYNIDKETKQFSMTSKKIVKEYLLDKIIVNMKSIYLLNNDLISVVVPIYNVEKYLNRCIDSILSQTYSNLEIILVDDGSTDNSGIISDEYALFDSRVKVIHKKNGGLSDARNYGIKAAHGEYITFIDSDDYVRNDYVEVLYSLIQKNNSEISVAICKKVYENNDQKSIYNVKKRIEITDNKFTMLEHMLYQKLYDTYAWAKLYKLSLFNDVKFPKGKLYEDLATIYKLILKSSKVSYINEEIYYYFIRNNSITNCEFNIKDMELIEISQKVMHELILIDQKNGLNDKLTNAAISKFLSSNFTIIKKIGFNKKYKSNTDLCIRNIQKYKKINVKSRLKNNIAIALFLINPRLFKYF